LVGPPQPEGAQYRRAFPSSPEVEKKSRIATLFGVSASNILRYEQIR